MHEEERDTLYRAVRDGIKDALVQLSEDGEVDFEGAIKDGVREFLEEHSEAVSPDVFLKRVYDQALKSDRFLGGG